MKTPFVLPALLALVGLVSPGFAQVFPTDAWLVRERIDETTAENRSLAVLGAVEDPRGNDGAIALRCSARSAEGFQAFIDFDAFHGNEGVFEVDVAWGDDAPETLTLAPSADLSAGFVTTGSDRTGFVRNLRSRDRLVIQLRDVRNDSYTYVWELPSESAALDRLDCLPQDEAR